MLTSEPDECAAPARLDPRRRHRFLTLSLGYHVGQGRRAKDTPEHLITQVIPKHLAQVHVPRRGHERQGDSQRRPGRAADFVGVPTRAAEHKDVSDSAT